MKLIERLHAFIFRRKYLLDDFEWALVNYLIKGVENDYKQIIKSQISHFNKTYHEFDEAKETLRSYFYWKYFGKSRLDLPLKFTNLRDEKLLASLDVKLPSGDIISVKFWVVCGVLFYIELFSKSDIYRPLNPDFKIINAKFFRISEELMK